jgi:hypothetical protein
MSGVVIALALMRASDPLVAAVPEANIIGDVIPVGSGPPAIGAVTISQVYDRPLRRGSTRRVTERVQVTWIANDASRRRSIAGLVLSAVDGKYRTTLAGATNVATEAMARGPDFIDDAGRHGGSIDVMVSYNEAA